MLIADIGQYKKTYLPSDGCG